MFDNWFHFRRPDCFVETSIEYLIDNWLIILTSAWIIEYFHNLQKILRKLHFSSSKSILARRRWNILCNAENGLAMFFRNRADTPRWARTAILFRNLASPFLRCVHEAYWATDRIDCFVFQEYARTVYVVQHFRGLVHRVREQDPLNTNRFKAYIPELCKIRNILVEDLKHREKFIFLGEYPLDY